MSLACGSNYNFSASPEIEVLAPAGNLIVPGFSQNRDAAMLGEGSEHYENMYSFKSISSRRAHCGSQLRAQRSSRGKKGAWPGGATLKLAARGVK